MPIVFPVEPVQVVLHFPRPLSARATVDLIDRLAESLRGTWDYRHPIGAPLGVYHIHVSERPQ